MSAWIAVTYVLFPAAYALPPGIPGIGVVSHVTPAASEQLFAVDDSLWESLVGSERRRPGWLIESLGIRHIPPEPSMN